MDERRAGGREPLLTVSPSWQGLVATRWMYILVALTFTTVVASLLWEAAVGDAGSARMGWFVWGVWFGTVAGYLAARTHLSRFEFYDDRVVAVRGTIPGRTTTREVPYDRVAFVVRNPSILSRTGYYVVHEDGVLVLRNLPRDDEIRALLEEHVPPLDRRARGLDRRTARWFVYDDLEEDDGVVVDRSRVKEVFEFDDPDFYTLAPGRLAHDDAEGIDSVADVSPTDVCLNKNKSPIYPLGRG